MKPKLIVLVAALGATTSALPAPHCTQHTTRGQWMYTCEGDLGAPAQGLGTCTASPTAFWQCRGRVNVGGGIHQQTFVGQAHNNEDCTGTISYETTLDGQPSGVLHIDYVIYDQGGAIKGLPLNSGGVLACSLKRISISVPNVP